MARSIVVVDTSNNTRRVSEIPEDASLSWDRNGQVLRIAQGKVTLAIFQQITQLYDDTLKVSEAVQLKDWIN